MSKKVTINYIAGAAHTYDPEKARIGFQVYGVTVLMPEAGIERTIPWTSILNIETTGITQEDINKLDSAQRQQQLLGAGSDPRLVR